MTTALMPPHETNRPLGIAEEQAPAVFLVGSQEENPPYIGVGAQFSGRPTIKSPDTRNAGRPLAGFGLLSNNIRTADPEQGGMTRWDCEVQQRPWAEMQPSRPITGAAYSVGAPAVVGYYFQRPPRGQQDPVGVVSIENMCQPAFLSVATPPIGWNLALIAKGAYSRLFEPESRRTGSAWISSFGVPPQRDEDSVIVKFALGVGVKTPGIATVAMAARVVHCAFQTTVGTHVTVDDEDGDLDFHLRLKNGLLVMANIFHDGGIDATVFDDRQGSPVRVIKRLKRSETTEGDLLRLFRAGI